MADEERLRITVTLDRETFDVVTELAKRMGLSDSKMAAMLLEAGVEDNELIIKLVTSKFAKAVKQAVGGLKRGVKGAGRKKSEGGC